MKRQLVLAVMFLVITANYLLGQVNSGPVSAADQQMQAQDLAGKRGKQQVDLFTGSFDYSIPISCAPARNGSEPSLALTYSSGGGDDWCGMGWQLQIGSIERNTKDGFPIQYSTGNPAAPLTAYDNSKGFLLNLFGKELKLLPTATTNEFDAEVDTDFLRCVLDTTNNRWLVYDKSGNVYYFGQVAASRMSNPKTGWSSGSTGTFYWALDQVVTATGDNTMVAYTNYISPYTGLAERTLYPAQLTYNGHVSNNGYTAAYNGSNTITFATGLRTDKRFSFRDGFRTEQNRILTNILCQVGSQKVWQYSLIYTASPATGRSLLSTLTTYGFDLNNNATALPVQTFGYQNNLNGVSFGPVIAWTNMMPFVPGSTSSTDPEVTTAGTYGSMSDLMDMDGDGLPDRVVLDNTTQPNQYQVQHNNGNGGFNNRYAFGPSSTATSSMNSTVAQSGSTSNLLSDDSYYSALNSPDGRIRDLNGDGLPDRVMDYWPAINSINNTYPIPYTNFETMLNTGSGFAGVNAWPVGNLIAPGDANGIGITYECVEGGGSANGVQTSVGLLDLNGDGLPDHVEVAPATDIPTYGPVTNLYVQVNTSSNFTGWRLFPYQSMNWNGSGTSQSGSAVSLALWTGLNTSEAQMIDLNGDGLPDHVMFPMNPTNGDAGNPLPYPSAYFAVEYNDGYAFESTNTSTAVPGAFDRWPGVAATGETSYNYNGNQNTYRTDALAQAPFTFLYDLNGDGLPDRVVVDLASLSVTGSYDTWYVYLNNGTGFNTNPIVLTNISNQGQSTLGTSLPWWSPQCSDNNGDQITTMIDINGDGLLDRVMCVYDNGNGVANTTSNFFLVQLNNGPFPDLLTNINNGLGGNLSVTYKPSTAYDNSRVSGSPQLGSELPFIYQTVSTVTENDGINAARTTSYGYQGGYYNGPRREFHGFAVVGVTNPPSPIAAPYNRTTVYYFHQGGGQSRTNLGEYLDPANFAKDGMEYRVETYGNDNKLYHVTVNQVNQAALPAASGYARYFPYTQLTFDCDYPGGGTPRTTLKQFAYDLTNGNLTNEFDYGEVTNFSSTNVGNFSYTDVNSGDNRQHNSHYTAINTYILDHPDKENLTDGSGNTLRETDYTYNSSSGEILTKATLISPPYYATNTYGNYTSYGLVGLTTDPVGVVTEITYDSTFNQYPFITRIRANPASDGSGDFGTTNTYDPRSGLVTGTTDPMDVTVTNTYDALQRLTESDKIPVNGTAVWQKKFDYPATLQAITSDTATNYIDTVENDGVGGFTNRTYVDGFERPIQTLTEGENSNYRVVSTAYDERGKAFLTTWPTFAGAITYTKPVTQTAAWTGFDAPGRPATNRLVTATFVNGVFSSLTALAGDSGSPLAATTFTYTNGVDPWWVIVTDPDGDVRRYGLDAFGRTNQIQEVNGSSTYVTTLKYDQADELTNIVDATGTNNIYWGFDNAGGMVSMADPHLGVWKYQRDYAERLRQQTDGDSNVVVLSYVNPATGWQDVLGRVQTKLVTTANTYTNQLPIPVYGVTNLYDASTDGSNVVYKGLLYETVDSQGWEKEGYDSRGRMIQITRYLNINGRSYTTTNTYNDGDDVTSTAYPNGGPVITNTYFHGGSLNLVSRSGSTYNYYTVNAANYDVFEHVTNFLYGNTLTETRTYYPVSARLQNITAGSVFTRSYQYTAGDDISNLSGTGLSSTSVAYDGVHRIKTYNGLTGSYGFDPDGNMTTNIESGAVLAYGYGVRRGQAVKLVNGSSDLYDLCGNMIVRQTSATNGEQLVYDGENQLVRYAQVNTNFTLVKFGYSGDNARLWKWSNLTTNLQVWIGNIYEEKGGKVLFHVFAGSEQICTFETNSPLMGGSDTTKVGDYYHEDSLNSSSALSSSTGGQTEVNVFYPFGQIQTASPQAAFQVSRRFTGQVFDNETGLYYYNARYYDPYLGRFIQADTEISDLSNPQSYNRYTYCVNDPLRYNDPSGHVGTVAAFFGLENIVAGHDADVWARSINYANGTSRGYKSFDDAKQQIAEQKDPSGFNADVRLAKQQASDLRAAAPAVVGMVKLEINAESSIVAPEATALEGTAAPKVLTLNADKYPVSAANLEEAGAVNVPLTVNRAGATANRADAMQGLQKIPGSDLDEAPPAMFRKQGDSVVVRPTPAADNRGAGASLGNQARSVPDGGKVIIQIQKTSQ